MSERSRGDALLNRAKALIDIRRWEAALDTLAQVLATDPNNAAALCMMAHCYNGMGRHAKGLETANRAVGLAPHHWLPQTLRSQALLALGGHSRAQEALTAAQEAVRLAPENWRPHQTLAMALLALRRPRLALRAAERARDLAPDTPDPWVTLGVVWDALSDWPRAAAAWRQALALDPEHQPALRNLALLDMRRGASLRAILGFTAVIRNDPTKPYHMIVAGAVEGVLRRLVAGAVCLFVVMLVLIIQLDPREPWDYWPIRASMGTAALVAYAVFCWGTLRRLPEGARSILRRLIRRWRTLWLLFMAASQVAFTAALAYLPDVSSNLILIFLLPAEITTLIIVYWLGRRLVFTTARLLHRSYHRMLLRSSAPTVPEIAHSE